MATANGRPTVTTRSPAIIYDLAQLIHQQELAPVTIIGHSLGGMIALRYTGIYPDNVRRLVAIEGAGRIAGRDRRAGAKCRSPNGCRNGSSETAPAFRTLAAALFLDRRRLQAHAGGQPASLARTGAPPDPARRQPKRRRHLQLEIRQLRARQFALRNAARPRSRSSGSASTVPTLLVYGKESWAANPQTDGRLRHFRHARVVSFEDAGHWVHHDRLDAFLDVLRGFL